MTRPIDQSPEGEDPQGLHAKHAGDGALKAQAPNSPNINQIAKSLSDAQRRRFIEGTDLGCICRHGNTRAALIAKGFAVQSHHPDRQALDWTPLGLQVRTQLLVSKGLPND